MRIKILRPIMGPRPSKLKFPVRRLGDLPEVTFLRVRSIRLMPLWNDVRFACRQLRKSPAFTLIVLATLGLCIGANTAIYSVIDAVLVRPLPYPQADRLASLARHVRSSNNEDLQFGMNGAMWEILYRNATKIDVAAEGGVSGVNLAAGKRIEYVREQRVSSGYFHVLGVLPQLGREFDKLEDTAGGPSAVVL